MAASLDRTYAIGDLVSLQRGNTYKSSLLEQPGPVLLGLASIARNGGFRTDSLRTYGGESAEKLLLRPGDLFVSLKDVTQAGDLLGAVARVPSSVPLGRLTQDTVKLEFKSSEVPRALVYWALRSPQYREYCRARAIGTTNLSLSREDFLAFRIPILTTSRSVAVDLLEAIENKIDLNHRMNKTLEAMARALFNSWFLNFDPVRAKAARQKPFGMDAETAALFAARLVDSTIGPVPEGWAVMSVAEGFEINPMRSLAKGELAPYLDMGNMPTDGHHPSGWHDREFGSGMRFTNGDTLLARITPCLENGKTAFVDFLADDQIGWGSTEYIVFRPKPPLPPSFAYYLCRDQSFRTFAIQNMSGSTGRQRVPSDCFRKYQIAAPPARVAEAFDAQASVWMKAIRAHHEESRTLSELRDALLPKLLSGEIRVKDAERVAGKVG